LLPCEIKTCGVFRHGRVFIRHGRDNVGRKLSLLPPGRLPRDRLYRLPFRRLPCFALTCERGFGPLFHRRVSEGRGYVRNIQSRLVFEEEICATRRQGARVCGSCGKLRKGKHAKELRMPATRGVHATRGYSSEHYEAQIEERKCGWVFSGFDSHTVRF